MSRPRPTPTNGLVDLRECARLADELAAKQNGHRPLVVVDNTFLGPVWQQALKHGADISVYSLTKCVAGHSDVVAGAAIGSKEMLAPVMGFRTILGHHVRPPYRVVDHAQSGNPADPYGTLGR